MNYILINIKHFLNLIYNLYKNYKVLIIIFLFLFFIINLIFFLIYYNFTFLIFIYNNFFISIIDSIIYYFKFHFITSLQKIYDLFYKFKYFLIQKYYSIFEYNFMKNQLKKNNDNFNLNNENSYINYIHIFFYKNFFFKYFNIFQNSEYYKNFDPKLYSLDFIYSYNRKGECSKLISDPLLITYLPDKGKLNNYNIFNKINKHYNYIYTYKHVKRQKSLFLYNDLYFRRNFFIINNNKNNFFKNKELLHYEHDLEASELDSMSIKLEESFMKNISAFNYRRKDSKERLLSFEKFDEFNNSDIIIYENAINLNNNNDLKNKDYIDKLRYKIFMNRLKKNNYYDNLLKISILEKNLDNFYITGTTEIYYFDKMYYRLIKFIGLTDYFFYYLYYSFIEIPFFFEDFNFNLNKDTNFIIIIKKFLNEILKYNNIYIILIFFYSLYLSLRSLILNELDLLYALLFFKRHLTFLILIAFIIKFNLDILDPISFELFLILWIPGIINYIVYEEWWWVWWTNFEKVKYHYTFNYEGVLYGPINICFIYLIIPYYLQSFLIFKLLILHYLIFHFNRVDLKWKYIIKKNIFYYFFLLYILIFYNLFLLKEEINLLKSRFKIQKNYKNLDLFHINFNFYSRNFLINLNNILFSSLFIIIKKYIQFFFYYIYIIFFFFIILIMFYKIIYNINFIFYFNFIKNDLDLYNFIKYNSNYFLFLKNNINLVLLKEYQIIQRNHYYKYNIIYDYANLNGFQNKLYYKFHYPGLIFYRTSRNFNGNLYWLYFQGGNNFIGETYYKATILDNFYKKNLSYFYKYFIIDSKNYNYYWTKEQINKYINVSHLDKILIKKRKIKRLISTYCFNYKIYLKNLNLKNNYNYNYINYKGDIKFINSITKNFYKTTTYYTNNKTYFFSLYTYKYYNKNYPLAMDDMDINIFIRKMFLHARAWGKYHMGSNFLPMYTKFIVKYSGKSLIEFMNDEYKNKVPFISLIKKGNSNNILLYNKYIPNRLDYIKFHSIFYDKVYSLYDIELEQTILDKSIVKEEIIEDNSISIFTLIFNYKEYIRLTTERDLSKILSIKIRLPSPNEYVVKKQEYI